MAFNRLKGLARRVKRRVGGPGPVGDSFGPAQDAAFARLDDNAEASFQIIGASVVSTWEILLTDLARAASGAITPADSKKMVERISDALVPTQEALQQAGRAYRKALKLGVQQALRSGRLSDATGPVCAALGPLPSKLAQGWVKTAQYLEPVLSDLSPGGDLLADFVGREEELRAAIAAHNAAYTQAMQAMAAETDLSAALGGALDTWRDGLARTLELFLYDRRTAMVDAAKRLPR